MKNVLVQYQGGGYDGCIWEWNYFYLDGEGKFHDVWHTGCAGIDNQEGAQALLGGTGGNGVVDTHFVYNVMDESTIEEFNKESNPQHVLGVLQWFNQHNFDVMFFARCTACGEKITEWEEASLQNWYGCGGIMVSPDALICNECHSAGLCDCCGDYAGEANIIALYQTESDSQLAQENKYIYPAIRELIDKHFDCVCQYCLDAKANDLEDQDKTDLLWLSRTTGKPDMFSDEMRWFWDNGTWGNI
jgi:hypothetical protein